MDYKIGEALYREFIEFRKNFIKDSLNQAIHSDTTEDGRKVRPIVVVPYKKVGQVQEKIDKWAAYVYELEQYPELAIPKTLLYPIPEIISGVRAASAYNTEAVNSRPMTAGRIAHLIEKDLRTKTKSDAAQRTDDYINNLNETLAILKRHDPDEPMRMRIHGFRETVININYVSTHSQYNDGKKVTQHVPLCGVFINDEALRDGFNTDTKFTRQSWSIYDGIDPIICLRWPTARIYFVKDLDKKKESTGLKGDVSDNISSSKSANKGKKIVGANPDSA